MNQDPTEQPANARRRLPWRILLAVVVAVAFVFAGYYLIAQDSVVELTITDGSVTGTIQGDFCETSQDNAIYSYLNATTYAERTDRPASTLELQIVAITYWSESSLIGVVSSVRTILHLTAIGSLDSELDARSLEIVYNQTADGTTAQSLSLTLYGINISNERQTAIAVQGNESGTLKADLVNRTVSNAIYEFSLSGNIIVEAYGDANLADRFMCIRAIVNGKLEPEFSASVSILMVNTSEVS